MPEELAEFEAAGLRWEARLEVPLADGEYPTDRVYETIGLLHRPA